jgi:hypothetical protein
MIGGALRIGTKIMYKPKIDCAYCKGDHELEKYIQR